MPNDEEKPVPGPIPPGAEANYATLRRASANGDLAAVSAIRKADGARVTLLCAMEADGEGWKGKPLAVMIEGDPFELFEDPFPGGP